MSRTTGTSTTETTTADFLREAVTELSGIPGDELAGDANLVQLGVGSLEVMRLATRWRRRGLAVEFAVLAAEPTIDAWAAHVDDVRGAAP
ncbi:phosphopantetheine-binding protein [Pseudonocardia sp. TRM90224]|uniref:phosphopantetheine-binding protein n=1 Tax=Pseudonocardia sp. TRM90224 TaxID=2812678 RepID=UPI001E3238AF|nr:phosphopantetheine-binding protein [Pseudonocardia sp. TRM90224]